MQKITVLPPAIFNLLAAGEVVENPAAIVKECVENSLDAHAPRIEIAIENGGLDMISITDNGAGIDAAEAEKVFLPHATSKISAAADLERIATLGFRGEALSSIAAVSRVTLVTRTSEQSTAVKLTVEAGRITAKTTLAANVGTRISIANLFYNTPARKKFLAKPGVEKFNVTGVIQKFILANPHVSLKYTADGDILYDYRGKSLKEAIKTVYDGMAEDNIIAVDCKNEKFALRGYISKPSYSRRNRTWQTVMVNGRVIEGGIISAAVNEAFSNYMTVGNFPFFVLNLTVDFSAVDVNVHPRKAEIKFSDGVLISEFIKISITNILDSHMHNQFAVNFEPKKDAEFLQKIKHFSSSGGSNSVQSVPQTLNKFVYDNKPQTQEISDKSAAEKLDKSLFENFEKPAIRPFIPATQTAIKQVENNFNILGTVFDTYILITQGDKFIMLDQHAASERLAYDKLRKEIDAGAVVTQALLEPCVVTLSPPEMIKMETAAPYLNEMGIECAQFGNNTYRVTAVPTAISPYGVETVIGEILRDIRAEKLSDVLKDRIIMQCCKNAVKAGDTLNHTQIAYFLEQLFAGIQTPMCPHGRPIFVAFTRDKLEKLFSRK